MNRLIAASAIALITSSSYAADDFIIDEVALVEIRDTFSWEGGYIGANAGYAGGKFKHPFSISDGQAGLRSSIDVTSSGFAGGVQAGYNWQFGNNIIAGIEADLQGTSLKGSLAITDVFEAGTRVNWFGTIRARIGFAPIERLMVYGTGGYAYGRVKTYIDGEGSTSKTKSGWTIGAGTEYALDTNWTLKTEYLYTDLGKMNLMDGSDGLNASAKVRFHTVRAGINYKF